MLSIEANYKELQLLMNSSISEKKSPFDLVSIDSTTWDKVNHAIFGQLKEFPISVLRGTQERSNYRDNQLRSIDKAYKYFTETYGHAEFFLRQNPPLVCTIQEKTRNIVNVLILNGHHRIRRAANAGISYIPCYEFSPEIAVYYVNLLNQNVQFTAEEFAEYQLRCANKAEGDFSHCKNPYPQPVSIDVYKNFRRL